MKEDIYLTSGLAYNSNLQNISTGSGLVMLVTSTCLGQDAEFWTAKPVMWINSEMSPFVSYADVHSALVNTGVFSSPSRGTYIVSLSETSLTAQDTIRAIANVLEHSATFNPKILD